MRAHASRGFTYLTALFLIAFMGVGAMAVGTAWESASKREREAELLFVGNSYRVAIQRYYLAGPTRRYPAALQDLLKDPRLPATQRYLRQLYPDPITGTDDWGIVKAPDGGVMGVYSKSELEPVKTTHFKTRDRDYERGTKNSDWKYVFTPAATKPAPSAPGPKPAAAPAGATPQAPAVAPAAK